MEHECATGKCLKVSLHQHTARLVTYTSPSSTEADKSLLFCLPHCSIVRSYEGIVSMFAQRLDGRDRIPFRTENILVVTEQVSMVVCRHYGSHVRYSPTIWGIVKYNVEWLTLYRISSFTSLLCN